MLNNDTEIYSTHNKRKSVVADRFIKIHKYMTLISKSMYIDKLDDIVNEYNNTYHRTIKMKLVDVTSSTYIDFNVEKSNKDPDFEVSDDVRISKYKIM